jgi:hypothetical protein
VSAGHVFGYASLVGADGLRPATLRGHRRVWGVAMDNSRAVPGYKVYELPDGTRPPLAVAFLDLEATGDPGHAVDGALLPVDGDALARLDDRERQYERVDVRDDVVLDGGAPPSPDGPIWAYVGRAPGRARVAAGRAGTAAVAVQRAYVELVEAAFAARGEDALARYRASTEPPPFPVLELARIDLPA